MKRSLSIVSILSMLSIIATLAFALEPATITYTNFRGRASIEVATAEKYWQGDVLRFTNMLMYSGSGTNSAIQDLTACRVVTVLGDSTTNRCYTNAIQSTNGLWWGDVTVPPVDPCYIQTTVTATNTGTNYTYWTDKINTGAKIGD